MKRIVVKVGTSTLTYENGKSNLKRIERLCKVLSGIHNSGREVILVSSGAIAVGMGKIGLKERPTETKQRQALAAIGQCELMSLYSKLFSEYSNNVAQVLLTRDIIDNAHSKEHVINTFETLLNMGIIPIVNENDTVATDELDGTNFGDNDTLSAIVSKIVKADLLVILTDFDGLYEEDPRINPNAKKIKEVLNIDDTIKGLAKSSGSNRGTGGMKTKISAAEFATKAGIDCCVMSGNNPNNLYKIFDGEIPGTIFKANI